MQNAVDVESKTANHGGSHGRLGRFLTQVHALLLKSISYQRRNAGANATLAGFPVFVCVLLVVMQGMVDSDLGKPQFRCGCGCVRRDARTGACAGTTECGIQFSTPTQAPSCGVPAPQMWPPLVQVPNATERATTPLQHPRRRCSSPENCPVTVLLTGHDRQLAQGLARDLFPPVPVEYYLGPNNASSSWDYVDMFSRLVIGTTSLPGKGLLLEPALVPNKTALSVLQLHCPWNSSTTSGVFYGVPLKYDIQCVQALLLWRGNSSVINQHLYSGYAGGNKQRRSNQFLAGYDFLDTSMRRLQVHIWYNSTFNKVHSMAVLRVPQLVNMASKAYLKLLLGADAKMHLDYVKEMPKPETKMKLDLATISNAQFFTFTIQLLFPIAVTFLVYEKEQRLRLMMKMHGLKNVPYLLISYAYFLSLSTAYMIVFAIFGYLIGLEIFRLNSYGVQLIFYFTYINLQIVHAFLFASLFSSTKTASVTSNIYVLCSGILSGAFFIYFIRDTTFPKHWLVKMELFPSFSLYRGIFELAEYASAGRNMGKPGMQWMDLNDPSNGMKDVLVLMNIEWVVLLAVVFLLDSSPAWYPLSLSGLLSTKRSPRSAGLNEVNTSSRRVSDHIEIVKPDVFLECQVVRQSVQTMGMRSMIICDDLKKVYLGKNGNPDKVAVRGLSLALQRGQCFGMLGPSGSGKTTFINMMIGLALPTHGTAYIDGMDLRKDMNEIHASIGVCPQHEYDHNLLWETLTGREHLMFYGRMKNLTGFALTKAVEESLKSVNLFHSGFGDKPVSMYSGGMKRRLSVAIALIGNPKVVYLDEPSTGLDPISRSHLWNVVKQAKKACTIILTTHSMEEAEKLCDRVGIFVNGEFHCIGTPNELKARYGGTRTLTIMTEQEHVEEVENLVKKISPSASRIYNVSGNQKYMLPRGEVGLDEVFGMVEMARRAFTVLGWGVSDATMEDVFISVVKEAQPFDEMF